ncbi:MULTISPECIES: sugar ABC transporter substrate-binding protein [unclassified Paenibacillus]|uniref:ABC transporter substrate-binding protein n=1 Tax=unclassified Paenibacillus TaxID=185978 RepID=UPI00095667B5|nr:MULTISPECIES: sugar ABC transporter substrate-binding protein [unclassified Paenibacillus]ASS69023.1 sugar ABC transporter substrate-binding protein [Paenibacillus sp. RUD330]SIR10145.1 multiple sugar transport system substrate-binding protein [Paenibacillus sp. RU4X]SIR26419.1 multiple sugar transport system substrate-binding protein [Paenibacillus sp. RU4T]
MKTRKRYAGLTAIALMGSMMLAACGSNGNPEENSSANAPASSPAAAPSNGAEPSGEKISGKITYSQWGTNVETEQTKELLKAFNEAYPDIQVEVVSKDWGTYWTSLTAQASSKDLPDVYKISYAYVDKYAKLGALKDLTGLISSSNFSLSDFEPGVLAAHQVDGKQVSLPRDANTIVLYYNKGLFDDKKSNPAGAAYPGAEMTWDEALGIAKKMTIDKNGKTAEDPDFDPKNIVQWGLTMDPAGSADSVLEPQLISAGGALVTEDQSLAIDSPEDKKVLEFFRDLVTKEHVTPTASQSQSLSKEPFLTLTTGKVAMSFAGSWSASEFKKANIKFDTVLPPKFKETKTVVQVAGNALSPYSKNEKAAWALLSWLAGPEGQVALAKQGQSIPANKQAADTYLGTDEGYNKSTFIDAQKFAITTPFFDGKEKLLWEIIPQKLAQPLSGKGSLDDVLGEIKSLYGK